MEQDRFQGWLDMDLLRRLDDDMKKKLTTCKSTSESRPRLSMNLNFEPERLRLVENQRRPDPRSRDEELRSG